MKPYPNQILLTVADPRTGKDVCRWFRVNDPFHEKTLREQVTKARAAIQEARERMAAAVGAPEQKMVVENLAQEFVEYKRRPDVHA